MVKINMQDHEALIAPMQFLMDTGGFGYEVCQRLEPELPDATVKTSDMTSILEFDKNNYIVLNEMSMFLPMYDLRGQYDGDLDALTEHLTYALDQIETFLHVQEGTVTDANSLQVAEHVQSIIDNMMLQDEPQQTL